MMARKRNARWLARRARARLRKMDVYPTLLRPLRYAPVRWHNLFGGYRERRREALQATDENGRAIYRSTPKGIVAVTVAEWREAHAKLQAQHTDPDNPYNRHPLTSPK